MSRFKSSFPGILLPVLFLLLLSCQQSEAPDPKEKDIVEKPEQIDVRKAKNIEEALLYAIQNNGRINDTVLLRLDTMLLTVYKERRFSPLWSKDELISPLADSLIDFIEHSKEYGLFPSDYHNKALHNVQALLATDSASQKNAALWSRADLMLTDAFFLISKHLKQGRLSFDSVTLRTDTILTDSFYNSLLADLKWKQNVKAVFHALEPKHRGYDSLKAGLKFFLDSIKTFKRYTHVIYPNKDSAAMYQQLQRRLFEEDILPSPSEFVDSAQWKTVISNYQKTHGLKVTGKINENTINRLNNTDWEKFKQIVINLDRYKLLPDTMPEKYVWVNIPSYYLHLIDSDTVVFKSRIVVGKPQTRTPVLTSRITDMITYPQWTIPTSIIVKEVLPGVKKNPNYFTKHGYSLIDGEGNEVDPATVNWQKYSKGIPYKVIQGSGDANALGVLKFNFSNKYSVYLHDTNQRYLFSNSNRSLSHGCVRVQEWQKLAKYLIANDSINRKPNTSFIGSDSLKVWLQRKEKHYLPVRNRVPLFIRYFSCEGINGKVKFYEDIYREDKILRERYFADKSIQ
jgi:murein L,D-transpeptidase YcbB/YkuD